MGGIVSSVREEEVGDTSHTSPDILPIAKNPSFHTFSSNVKVSVSPSDVTLGIVEELVPTVMKWKQGGGEVFVTGTFNNWKEKIPMRKSNKDFTTIQYLPAGVHQYKFIVDGKWRHAPDQPMAADRDGILANCMEVRKPPPAHEENPFESSSPPGEYGQVDWIKKGTFKKDPPSLPPHLLRALLNTAPVSERDPTLLPLPHHVMINHAYYLTRPNDEKHRIEVIGSTQRFRTKFVTTVIYKQIPIPKNMNSPPQ